MDRLTFLRIVAATGCAPVLTLLESCAPAGYILHATPIDGRIRIAVSTLPDFAVPNTFVKVYADRLANPLLLFPDEQGNLRAILSTCSHSGCEVQKLRTKFECPCHGSEYDLHGNVTRGPAPDPLDTFMVERKGETIEIVLG